MSRSRATGAELELRTREVVGLLTTGACRNTVLKHCRETWGVSPRSADRLLARARQQIKADWENQRSDITAGLLSSLSSLEQQAREASQLGVALACINSIAKLAGLL